MPKQKNWINLRLGYEKEEFKLFSPEASFENQITNKSFNGLSVRLSYNSYLHDYDTLVSFAIGISQTNNASLLKKVELTDETVYGTSDENITRSSKKTFTARQGTFETFNLGYILLSSFWKPSKLPFGIIAYGRYNYSRLVRSLNLGTGIYILKSKEKSLVPLGGIVVEFEDKFDSEMKDVSFGDRFTVNLALTLPLFMTK